jgi:ABC-2 type transport system permease protein
MDIKMLAVYKREMRGYFATPLGYVFLGIFLAVAGAVFCYTTFFSMTSEVTGYFTTMLNCFIILLPLLTMKLFTDEKKQKTEQLLLTSPVSLFSIVFGKFFAAYTLFAGATLFSSLYFLLLALYGNVQGAIFFGNLLAVLLVGMAFIAIGTFVSAITESQLSAAVVTIGILAGLMAITLLCDLLPDAFWLRYVIEALSPFYRFANFANGIFDFVGLFYYLSVTALFLFLTVRVFDRRRFH